MSSTQIVADAFSKAAAQYDGHASVQLEFSRRLADDILRIAGELPEGPILEVGCGTGSLTETLASAFPQRQLEATDISPGMLEQCRQRLRRSAGKLPENVTLNLAEAGSFHEADHYALIASSFALHWTLDLSATLDNLSASLTQGGMLMFCLPIADSFGEWRLLCNRTGVPYTGNKLPQVDDFRACAERHRLKLKVYKDTIVHRYASPLEFFRSLRSIGAATKFSATTLSVRQMRQLLRAADNNANSNWEITYRVARGSLIKP